MIFFLLGVARVCSRQRLLRFCGLEKSNGNFQKQQFSPALCTRAHVPCPGPETKHISAPFFIYIHTYIRIRGYFSCSLFSIFHARENERALNARPRDWV